MEEYIISKEHLDKICKESAKVLVGETMKRFEIFDDKEDVKKEVKELIYESIRHLKKLIEAFSSGVKFITKKTKEQD